jgi:hypothetical protein
MTIIPVKKPTYLQCNTAVGALLALAKIGTVKGENATLKRLARQIRYCRVAEEILEARLEVLVLSHAEKTGEGERAEIDVVDVKTHDGQDGQRPKIKNRVEFARAEAATRREEVDTMEAPPRAFTWEELTTKFKEMPSADVIEALGPFGEMPKDDE